MATLPKYEIRLDSKKVKGLVEAIKELAQLVPEWQRMEMDEAVEKIGKEIKEAMIIIRMDLQ